MFYYSKNMHVRYLKKIVKDYDENPHHGCPAKNLFKKMAKKRMKDYSPIEEKACRMCLSFVNINEELWKKTCPCMTYGPDNAIKITKLKIKQYHKYNKK